MKMESMSESEMFDLVDTKVSDNRSLVVVDDLSTKQDWDCIKHYFPDNKNGSRVIVSTQHQEIASFCVEKQHQVSRLKQFPSDQCLCLFHKKVSFQQFLLIYSCLFEWETTPENLLILKTLMI